MVRVSDAGLRPRTMQIIHVPEPFIILFFFDYEEREVTSLFKKNKGHFF